MACNCSDNQGPTVSRQEILGVAYVYWLSPGQLLYDRIANQTRESSDNTTGTV